MNAERFAHASLMSGVVMALAEIVRELDAKGIIATHHLAQRYETAIEGLPEAIDGRTRLDVLMLKNLAKVLRGPDRLWTPVVLPGGLSQPKDDQSSDQ